MATCESCGTNAPNLYKVKIAGSVMNVCGKCRKMGKDLDEKKSAPAYTFKHKKKDVVLEEVVNNYPSLINSALTKKGLNFHQLAKVLNIKESTINKYVTGKIKPDVETAKRIEKFLEIKLTEEVDEIETSVDVEVVDEDEKSSGTTLGDLLKKQMGKK